MNNTIGGFLNEIFYNQKLLISQIITFIVLLCEIMT